MQFPRRGVPVGQPALGPLWPHEAHCLLRLCLAMLLHVREELLRGNFATCMKLLQRYPPVDVGVILARADALRNPKSVIILD